MIAARLSAALASAVVVSALAATMLAGCGTPSVNRGDGGTLDFSTANRDMTLACDKPGRCDNGAGTCCVRAIGPNESTFCDAQPCQLTHGVDTFESPVCATVADCYDATRTDLGTLYCCPDSALGGIGVCRFSPC